VAKKHHTLYANDVTITPGVGERLGRFHRRTAPLVKHRLRKVARTIADLAGEAATGAKHVARALQFRMI